MDGSARRAQLDLELWNLEEKEADIQRLVKYRCPCSMCAGGEILSRATIRKHLRRYKRDPTFTKSILVSVIFAFIEFYSFVVQYP
jgi:hypothetical protein